MSEFSGTSASLLQGEYYAEVVNIKDPENRGRIQCRVFGWQDDKSQIPDDKLIWMSTLSPGSQQGGIGSSHGYSVGDMVTAAPRDASRQIWQVKGAESGAKASPIKYPLMAVGMALGGFEGAIHGKMKRFVPPKSAKELLEKGPIAGGGEFKEVLHKYAHEIASGLKVKFKDMPNIGALKFDGGKNAIDFIKKVDPKNLAGAIPQALDLMKNMQKNGVPFLADLVGAGPLAKALEFIQGEFGIDPRKILETVKAIKTGRKLLKSITQQNFPDVIQELYSIHGVMGDVALGVAQETLDRFFDKIGMLEEIGFEGLARATEHLREMEQIMVDIVMRSEIMGGE